MNGRYTISRHDQAGGHHFDLFLENGNMLSTWRLSEPPETGAAFTERIGDHRLVYLDFEGEIQGNRGHVRIHSRGSYSLDEEKLTLKGGESEGTYGFTRQNILVRLDA